MHHKFCYIRQDEVDGEKTWLWVKDDMGAWLGPKNDWINHHKAVIDNMPQKRTVFQAGGCMGMYPRLLAKDFWSVYTFEPDPLNFYCLSQNCQTNKVFKYQAFLGNGHGFHNIWRVCDECRPNGPEHEHICRNYGMHSLDQTRDGPIPMLRIDDFGFQSVDLIWLDVEGLELDALKGGIETIKAWKPWIIVENGHLKPIELFLGHLGYGVGEQSSMDWVYKPK